MNGYGVAVVAFLAFNFAGPLSAQKRQPEIPPMNLGTSYDPCLAPKTDDRGVEVRELKVLHSEREDKFYVSACLATDLRDISFIKWIFVMHTRAGAMIDFHGHQENDPVPTHRPPKNAPYLPVSAEAELRANKTPLDTVRPEVLVIVHWEDDKKGSHSERYSVPFTFIPGAAAGAR